MTTTARGKVARFCWNSMLWSAVSTTSNVFAAWRNSAPFVRLVQDSSRTVDTSWPTSDSASGRGRDSSSRIRTRSQPRAREFQRRDSLFPRYRREVFQESLKRIACGQIINEVLERDSCACEDRVPPKTSGSHRTTDSKVGVDIEAPSVSC